MIPCIDFTKLHLKPTTLIAVIYILHTLQNSLHCMKTITAYPFFLKCNARQL